MRTDSALYRIAFAAAVSGRFAAASVAITTATAVNHIACHRLTDDRGDVRRRWDCLDYPSGVLVYRGWRRFQPRNVCVLRCVGTAQWGRLFLQIRSAHTSALT
jgi:hypothetical protein